MAEAAPAALEAAPEPASRREEGTQDKAATPGVEAQPCWRAEGSGWMHLGYMSQKACIARVFAGRCETIYGRWGDKPFRRYGAVVQSHKKGLFGGWKTAGESDCPASGAAR